MKGFLLLLLLFFCSFKTFGGLGSLWNLWCSDYVSKIMKALSRQVFDLIEHSQGQCRHYPCMHACSAVVRMEHVILWARWLLENLGRGIYTGSR